jgi:hypothetical protein
VQPHDLGVPRISLLGPANRQEIHASDDTTGNDFGTVEHPAPNVEPGDVLVLPDGREALVTARVEARPGPLEALLEVVLSARQPRPSAKIAHLPVLPEEGPEDRFPVLPGRSRVCPTDHLAALVNRYRLAPRPSERPEVGDHPASFGLSRTPRRGDDNASESQHPNEK